MIERDQRLLDLLPHFPPLQKSETSSFDTQHDVFDRIQVRRQVQLLVDHRNPLFSGIDRFFRTVGPSIQENFAGIGLQRAADDLHQSAFSSSVFTDEGMDFAFAQIKSDIFQGDGGSEPLGDISHPQKHGTRFGHGIIL